MSGMILGVVRDENIPLRPELFDISDGSNEKNLDSVDLKLAKKEGG